jgi:ketosteroid isomerase-like protein
MSHARLLQDWLEGWNTRDLDQLMSHYAEDAVFISPSVLVTHPDSDGVLRGKSVIRDRYKLLLERHPNLRFELDEVINRPYGLIVIYRKLGVFAERPGLTVEAFELPDRLIKRNIVYWSLEEIASQFSLRKRVYS